MKKDRFDGLAGIDGLELVSGRDSGERIVIGLKCSQMNEKGCRREFCVGINLLYILGKNGNLEVV